MNKLLGHYKNGNYDVVVLQDGTKIRVQKDDEVPFIPSFAESMDITITQKCDGGCQYCYANCTPQGEHADLFKYNFINTLHPYTEVALNGNDLSHPQLEDFLAFLAEKKVIANITVNQKHFIEHGSKLLDWQEKGYVHGIGVSYTSPNDAMLYNICVAFTNVVIHTIAGIITPKDLEFISSQTNKGENLLVLGYKTKGRGELFQQDHVEEINKNIKQLEDMLFELPKMFKAISFDNLALRQLHIKDKLTPEQWESYYMGDEGSSTFFIDMVKGSFARSSLDTECFPIKMGKAIDDVDSMFHFIQKKYDGKIEGKNIL